VRTGLSGPDFWGEEGQLDLKPDQGLEGEPEEVGREQAENEFEVISGPDFRGEAGLVHRDFKPDNGIFGPDFLGEGAPVDRDFKPENESGTELGTEQTSAAGAARRGTGAEPRRDDTSLARGPCSPRGAQAWAAQGLKACGQMPDSRKDPYCSTFWVFFQKSEESGPGLGTSPSRGRWSCRPGRY
jgi:hypothetical protein